MCAAPDPRTLARHRYSPFLATLDAGRTPRGAGMDNAPLPTSAAEGGALVRQKGFEPPTF